MFMLSYDSRFKSELSFTLYDVLVTQGMMGKIREQKDVKLVLRELGLVCKNVLREQDIVMTIAHTESFLNDSLIAICRKKPAIIENSQKQVTWEKALSHMTRESLFEDLMAEYIDSQFRGKSVADRAVYFIKKHGLNLKLQGDMLADLELAEQVRHIIMHNGGRIDARFKKRTGVTDLEVGSVYPLDDGFVRNVALSAAELGGEVFMAISEKFFDEIPPNLIPVYKRTCKKVDCQ